MGADLVTYDKQINAFTLAPVELQTSYETNIMEISQNKSFPLVCVRFDLWIGRRLTRTSAGIG